jgi:hypothetical protein
VKKNALEEVNKTQSKQLTVTPAAWEQSQYQFVLRHSLVNNA